MEYFGIWAFLCSWRDACSGVTFHGLATFIPTFFVYPLKPTLATPAPPSAPHYSLFSPSSKITPRHLAATSKVRWVS
ncbi:unnamed protein product [Pylaiella littoralis]